MLCHITYQLSVTVCCESMVTLSRGPAAALLYWSLVSIVNVTGTLQYNLALSAAISSALCSNTTVWCGSTYDSGCSHLHVAAVQQYHPSASISALRSGSYMGGLQRTSCIILEIYTLQVSSWRPICVSPKVSSHGLSTCVIHKVYRTTGVSLEVYKCQPTCVILKVYRCQPRGLPGQCVSAQRCHPRVCLPLLCARSTGLQESAWRCTSVSLPVSFLRSVGVNLEVYLVNVCWPKGLQVSSQRYICVILNVYSCHHGLLVITWVSSRSICVSLNVYKGGPKVYLCHPGGLQVVGEMATDRSSLLTFNQLVLTTVYEWLYM